jgi:hypothetical protein
VGKKELSKSEIHPSLRSFKKACDGRLSAGQVSASSSQGGHIASHSELGFKYQALVKSPRCDYLFYQQRGRALPPSDWHSRSFAENTRET